MALAPPRRQSDMPRTNDDQAHIERRERYYRDAAGAQALLEIEREVLGCDYGGTSWTTREEAERFADLLGLKSGLRALELGAGSGWPGLYLARLTGGEVTLTDLPREGLRIALQRAAAEGLTDTCHPMVADGANLPFAASRFDAIYHCDVLC